MGGANQYRHSCSKRVNICGRVPSFYILKHVQIPSFVCNGTIVIELSEFNNKKKKEHHGHNEKIEFHYNLPKKWNKFWYTDYF